MAGTHHDRPGGKTRQSDKKLEEHESVLDSPEHIEGFAKSKSKHPQQKTRGEACDSALSGPECIEPEHQKKPSRSKG